jgi:hypothetical protein
MQCDILIIGTGSLSKATCYALSAIALSSLKICIAGRDKNEALSVAAIANARTRCFGSSSQFVGDAVVWDDENVEKLLDTYAPKVLFHASSLQSAWEFQTSTSQWSTLVNKVGYACTIPLQALLVAKVGHVIKTKGMNTILVNACYPDAVNALLHALELPILSGVGNIAILHKSLFKDSNVKMLGHHYHLTKKVPELIKDSHCFMAWQNESLLRSNPDWSIPALSAKGAELNQLTGAIAGQFLHDLLGDRPAVHHVPGPLGLHGGYPVVVSDCSLRLDLPQSITQNEAAAHNMMWADLDGVTIENTGFVRFSSVVSSGLALMNNRYAKGFHVDELNAVGEYFCAFKKGLQ